MVESSAVRWVLVIAVTLAIVGLLAYARGDDGDDGRSPEPGSARPALIDHDGQVWGT
jgi:hypothetical protein